MVLCKREREKKNLKGLLTKTDPYNTINNVDDEIHTYANCNKSNVIHVRTL